MRDYLHESNMLLSETSDLFGRSKKHLCDPSTGSYGEVAASVFYMIMLCGLFVFSPNYLVYLLLL